MKASRCVVWVLCLISQFSVGHVLAQEVATDINDVELTSLLDVEVSAAAKYGQETRHAPASVRVITAADIASYGYRTLSEALAGVRGLYTTYDRNYTYSGVRGFGRPSDYNNRVLILLDGHSVNEYVFGSSTTGTDLAIPMSAVERIEVVQGPGSALYGTSALFMTVNVLLKEEVRGIYVAGEVGEFGRKEAEVVTGGRVAGAVDVTVSAVAGDISGGDLYYSEFDDPSTNDGRAEGRDWDRYGGVVAQASYGDVTLLGKVSGRKKGVPTGAWETRFNDEEVWTYDARWFTEARLERDLSVGKNIFLRAFADGASYRGSYPYEEEDPEANGALMRIDSYDKGSGTWGGAEARLRWDTSPANRLVLGAEVQRHFYTTYRVWDDYEEYSRFDAPFTSASLYAQDEYQLLPHLALMLGARYDHYSDAGGALSPRLALVYDLASQSTIKFLYGTAFRAPSAYEMYYDDPLAGYLPNRDLAPEQVRTLEGVWEHGLGRYASFGLSLYHYRVRDLIDPVELPTTLMVQFQNQSRVNALGAEAELTVRTSGGVHGYASYAAQRLRQAGIGEHLTNSPTHLVKAGLTAPVAGLRAAAELRAESGRETIYGTRTDGFSVVDVNATTGELLGPVELSFRVRNVFDSRYALPGGLEHIQDAIEQDGRSVVFRAAFRL